MTLRLLSKFDFTIVRFNDKWEILPATFEIAVARCRDAIDGGGHVISAQVNVQIEIRKTAGREDARAERMGLQGQVITVNSRRQRVAAAVHLVHGDDVFPLLGLVFQDVHLSVAVDEVVGHLAVLVHNGHLARQFVAVVAGDPHRFPLAREERQRQDTDDSDDEMFVHFRPIFVKGAKIHFLTVSLLVG